MKKILLLLALSSNIHAEIITIDDFTLPPSINKEQWLKENSALPYNPNQVYDVDTNIYTPLKQSSMQSSHCQYGMDILGGCKNKPYIFKPLNIKHNKSKSSTILKKS
jgi:hypothetical protein